MVVMAVVLTMLVLELVVCFVGGVGGSGSARCSGGGGGGGVGVGVRVGVAVVTGDHGQ